MKTKLNFIVAGMFLAATSSALASVRYVNINNANPTPPYTNWATAATDIQSAVDAAGAGDEIVVTNGTYAPVTVDTPLALQSVNGPDVTIIDGLGGEACLYLAINAVVEGFTLTNGCGFFFSPGGGVYCESTNAVLTNCTLTGNLSYGGGGGAYGGTLNNCTLNGNSAWEGGGAEGCTLNNCTLTGNSVIGHYFLEGPVPGIGAGAYGCTLNNCILTGNSGVGAYGCTLNNCTLTGNSASGCGGGACDSTLNNCIVYFNSAPNGSNYDPSSTLNYCCTTPMPPNGVGNISADPQLASASYLSAESSCIGAGSAAYVLIFPGKIPGRTSQRLLGLN
jgi:parallel beta-helix repeat protein